MNVKYCHLSIVTLMLSHGVVTLVLS